MVLLSTVLLNTSLYAAVLIQLIGNMKNGFVQNPIYHNSQFINHKNTPLFSALKINHQLVNNNPERTPAYNITYSYPEL